MNDTHTQTIADALLLLSLGNDNEIGKDASERLMQLERENTALRSALTTLLAWEDKGGDIPPTAARGLFRIARAALDSARKEANP